MSKLAKFALVSIALIVLAGCRAGSEEDSQAAQLELLSVQDKATRSQESQLNQDDVSREGACSLSILDEQLLAAVNEARSEARWCGATHYQATTPVTWNCDVEPAAHAHSRDMADNNFFSHTGSDGLRVSHRVDRTDYEWSMLGENIAAGYTSVNAVMTGWLASPGHCATIMSDDYLEMSAAMVIAEQADYYTYWTLIMARGW